MNFIFFLIFDISRHTPDIPSSLCSSSSSSGSSQTQLRNPPTPSQYRRREFSSPPSASSFPMAALQLPKQYVSIVIAVGVVWQLTICMISIDSLHTIGAACGITPLGTGAGEGVSFSTFGCFHNFWQMESQSHLVCC